MQDFHDVTALREQFAQHGFRLTYQRRLILEFLHARQAHVTADEVLENVTRRCPELNKTTVYRTLDWLQEVGLIRKIDRGKGRLEYEIATIPVHHHLICTACGAEQEVDNHVMVCFREHVLEHYGFEPDPEHMAIFGTCGACRERSLQGAGPHA